MSDSIFNQPLLATRRQFLRTVLLGGALSWTVPSFVAETFSSLHAEALASGAVATGKDAPILIVLQMAGGNDGINTVVPYSNDFYFKARPKLALRQPAVLPLNGELALPVSMQNFKALYDAGNLAVVSGVGYPNPNRSHFRSTEIWQTASDANQIEHYGWIGRYFDNACQGCDATVGVSIGNQEPQAFAAATPTGVCLENPQNYRFVDRAGRGADSEEAVYRQLNRMDEPDAGAAADTNSGGSIGAVPGAIHANGSALDFLERTSLDAQMSSDKIRELAAKGTNAAVYPNSQLANHLKLIARLIGGGISTRVFYLSQGGYDTHVNQNGTHDRLVKDLADSVKAFCDDLKAQGNFERVLIMTFSEFGRRVQENASGGTDHGAAAPLFLIGPKLNPGLLGAYPSLAPGDLNDGDLKYNVDFRSIYATVLDKWLKTSSSKILGRQFAPLPLGLA